MIAFICKVTSQKFMKNTIALQLHKLYIICIVKRLCLIWLFFGQSADDEMQIFHRPKPGMTRRLLFLLALTTIMTGTAQRAPAATAVYTLNVTASVVASCTLTANALAFSTLNTTAATTATGSVTVNCTPGDALTIALNAGTHASSGQRRMSNGSNYVNYNIYQPTAAGTAESNPPVAWGDGGTTNSGTPFKTTGTGTNQTLNVYGQVPGGQTLYVGNYSDSVTVTLTY